MPCINIRQKPHIKAHLYKISELRDKVKMLKVSREKLWNGIFLLNSNTESWKTAKWCLLNLFHKGIIFILITEPKYQSPVRGHFQSPNVSKKKKKKSIFHTPFARSLKNVSPNSKLYHEKERCQVQP